MCYSDLKNHESWFGQRAPDHILFGLESLDNWLPALSEGPQWPDLLLYYAPTRRLKHLAMLSHRSQPLPDILRLPTQRMIRLGEHLEFTGDPTFLAVDIRYTWFGYLLSIIFKPPEVNLRLEYSDGRDEIYRLIPAIARAGFVASPVVKSTSDFIALALGEKRESEATTVPTAGAIEVSWLGSLAYKNNVLVTFRTIDRTILRAARPAGLNMQDIPRAIEVR